LFIRITSLLELVCINSILGLLMIYVFFSISYLILFNNFFEDESRLKKQNCLPKFWRQCSNIKIFNSKTSYCKQDCTIEVKKIQSLIFLYGKEQKKYFINFEFYSFSFYLVKDSLINSHTIIIQDPKVGYVRKWKKNSISP